MRVYFVRHGQTNYNILNLCNDNKGKDVHLTELGKQQAKEVANKLKDTKLEMVFISELPRTKDTAKIITKNHDVSFQVEPKINDRKVGHAFNDKPVSDFFNVLKPNPFNLKFDGGESFQEEKKRVFSFLEELRNLKCKTILVVTHGEILQIINGYYNNLSDQEMWDTRIDNCEVLDIEI